MTALWARLARACRANWSSLLVVTLLVVAFLVLRTSPSEIASAEAFRATLEGERPTVVYFYTNT